MAQVIDQSVECQIEGAQSLNYTNNKQMFYPERLRSQYFAQQDQLNRIRIIYLTDFIHSTFEQQIEEILKVFQKTSYLNFSFYPVLDQSIDWESTLGIAHDGICLCDNETQLGYLYFPYNIIKFEAEKNYLRINLKQSHSFDNPIYTGESRSRESLDSQIDRQKIGLFQKGMLKLTNKINLPVYTKINLAQRQKRKYDGAMVNFQLFHTEKQLHIDQNHESSSDDDINPIIHQQVRETILLKLLNEEQVLNICYLINYYKSQPNQKQIQRNLRVQSRCQTQLFYSLYMNYCIMYCAVPNRQLIMQIKEINEQVLLKNQQIIFNSFNLEDQQMNINDLRAFCDSLYKTLNYCKDSQTIQLNIYQRNENNMNNEYTSGSGTPYSPFVPIQKQFYRNLLIQKIQFKNNGFDSEDFIIPITNLLKNKHLQSSITHFTYCGNLLKQNSAILLGYNLSFCKQLQSLELLDTKCNSIGLSCLLYLFYSSQISLTQLAINIPLKTNNQVQQLAKYIVYSCKQNQGDFLRLNCTNVFTSTNQCYAFVKVLTNLNCRIKEVQMEDQEFQKILVIKTVADNIDV